MEYCATCGEPLLLALSFTGEIAEKLGATRYVPRNCACMVKMFAEEDAAEAKAKHSAWVQDQKMRNLKSEKYRKSTFDVDDGRNPKIRRMCERYVEKRRDVIEANHGLAFIGGNGGGKTFWASCIANALIEAGATVLMTKLKDLIEEMNADFGKDREIILRRIKNVQFLILDDYGAERGTDYSLEQAFEIIDARYNVEKPLIITANLTEETLNNPPNMNYARSYSRIIEMCPAIIKVEGERREEIAKEKRKALAELLRG
jgi:DNA replication protein DnaC